MGKIFSFKDTNMEIKEEKIENFDELREIVKQNEKREKSKPVVVIEFSWTQIALLLIILAAIFMGKQLVTVILFLFLGFVFTSTARPAVNWFMSKKISKGWAVVLTYAIALVLIGTLLSIVIVPLANQLTELVKTLPTWINDLLARFNGFTLGNISIDTKAVTDFVTNSIQALTSGENIKNLTNAVSGVFSTTGLIVSSLILSVYLVLEHDSILEVGLIRIVSDEKRERVKKLVVDVESKLGRWVLGQASISLIAGIFAGVVLSLFKVPFALPLAVLVALLDTIPSIGATIAIVACALVALVTIGPLEALILLVLFLIYQQIENNFINPKIMGNVIGLKPVVILLGAFIFLILFGVFGALLAVPVMVILQILYEFYIDLQKLKAKGIV